MFFQCSTIYVIFIQMTFGLLKSAIEAASNLRPRHLPEDAPNILIVMFDDAGYGQPSTFGGEIATPTFSRLADEGIAYNAFHTTAMCSPTRAVLLTGRNHHRVGAGQIAEFANDWDGYTGVIPKSSATMAEVLGHYGYATAAFGKWHNTPVADDYFEKAPFEFNGTLKRLYFKNLQTQRPEFPRSPDDD